jgi:hypothetical protein
VYSDIASEIERQRTVQKNRTRDESVESGVTVVHAEMNSCCLHTRPGFSQLRLHHQAVMECRGAFWPI